MGSVRFGRGAEKGGLVVLGIRRLFAKIQPSKRPTEMPKLDPPDVMASRVEQQRLDDLAAWQRLKAKGPLPEKVTRRALEKMLSARGYRKKRIDPDVCFLKETSDRSVLLWVRLKTFGQEGHYAPSQRLTVSASVCTAEYAAAEAEVMGEPPSHIITIASTGELRFKEFILTAERAQEIFDDVQAKAMAIDLDAVFAQFRDYDPARPGAGGLRHLCALALAGDVDTLDGYVRRRMDNDPCGFVPFITDDMIARAAKIGHRHG